VRLLAEAKGLTRATIWGVAAERTLLARLQCDLLALAIGDAPEAVKLGLKAQPPRTVDR
jgi:hypothetical protein